MSLAPLGSVALVLLRHPLLLASLALVVFVLLGGLRGMGLPRLFWHERPLHGFLAGAAVTLLAAQAFLVGWLEEEGGWPATFGFAAYWTAAAAVWAAVLLVCAALRVLHDHTEHVAGARRLRARVSRAFRISPSIATPGGREVSARAPVAPFLAGALVGGAAAGAVIFGALLLAGRFGPAMEEAARWIPWRLRDPPPHAPHLAALLGAALMVVAGFVLRRRATPAMGISFLLSLLLGVHGALVYALGAPGLVDLAAALLLVIGGFARYKLRISDLEPAYAEPTRYPPVLRVRPPLRAPLPWNQVCATWPAGPARPLVLVCASGGGLRAAAWTAGVLGKLGALPHFTGSTRLVTGASGGMVGAAAWIAALRATPGVAPDPARLCAVVGGMDALTEVARTLVFHDVPHAAWPGGGTWNRGEALAGAIEARLGAGLGADMAATLGELQGDEESGAIPSLVFSPMVVEDGRRLLLGSLDLSPVTDTRVLWLSSRETGTTPVEGLASRTAYHAAQLFPARWAAIRLSTAARLSAAFPYVSPAAHLPTLPRRRVVDAGYFDNYGLDLACRWLAALVTSERDWLRRQVSGVLVIQIRDNVSQLSVNPETDARRAPPGGKADRWTSGFEGLTSPIEGLLTARDSVMLFRNDGMLEGLRNLFRTAGFADDAVATTVFEFRAEASLSWTLSSDESGAIAAQVGAPGIEQKLRAVGQWLATRGSPAPELPAPRAH
jgi:hypothetical protein